MNAATGKRKVRSISYPVARRTLGVGLGAAGFLIIVTPILLLITLTIASDGPNFYRVPRLGLNRKLFKLPQFRPFWLPGPKRVFDALISAIALVVLSPV